MQLADVITSFRRHWRAAIASVLLVAIGAGLFLFLRDQTRPPDRWEASVQILVPARSEEGEIPEGVPPMLLQGQSTIALGHEVTSQAASAAGIPEDARDDLTFDFGSNERGDIYILTVTAPTEEQAQALADSYASAYTAARRDMVAERSSGSSQGAELSLAQFQGRFNEVESELERLAPELLASLPDSAQPDSTQPDSAQPGDEQAGTDEGHARFVGARARCRCPERQHEDDVGQIGERREHDERAVLLLQDLKRGVDDLGRTARSKLGRRHEVLGGRGESGRPC